MFKNYLIVAVRNFRRNAVFSAINVLGLSIGISAALVIFLIVHHEFSYDRFEQNSERIYRIVIEAKFNGMPASSPAVPTPLGAAVESEGTGVQLTVPVFQFPGDATAKVSLPAPHSDKPVTYKKQPDIIFTNQSYFELLGYQFIAGSPLASLQNPFAVVLTESRAKEYFPGMSLQDIPGKRITYNDEVTTTVTGVVKDLNAHTAFTGQEFISVSTISKTNLQEHFMMNVWNDWMSYTQLYVKLSQGNTVVRMESQLKQILKKYNKTANKDDKNTLAFRLQPLRDLHFNQDLQGVGQRTVHKPTLFGLLGVAAFLLLLGCINFINLTTAQASQRAKEIGIRKTLGSSKKQLIVQFLSETFLITLAATLLSVAITPLLLQVFSSFVPPGLQLDLLHQPYLFLFLFLLTIIVSFLSGLYPAFVLSAYRPVLVLKNQSARNSGHTRRAWVRKTLTVSQFMIAQFFVIGTFMVSKQIHYTLNKDLGFRKDAILSFEAPFDTVDIHRDHLLQELKAVPGVQMASLGFEPPAMEGGAFTNIKYNDGKKDIQVNVQLRWGDSNYIRLYHIQLVAGRNVLQGDNVNEFLVNETYARELGFINPQDAIGKMLDFNGKKVPVVGVMKDFHAQSLHGLIGSLVFHADNKGGFFHIALAPPNESGTSWSATLDKLALICKKAYPDADFQFNFLDETISKFYKSEQDISRLLKWATGLAVFISCLGLLGLVIYNTNLRAKEIGIRKVFGASVKDIVAVLSGDFMKLVFVAFVFSAPLAWWACFKWLQNFAYRTEMSWWLFIVCGLGMMVIAVITLSLQTIKAAIANPVKSLRTE